MSNLDFTVEQINRRLDLIAENKNLLPYPYTANLPTGLEDVGDGSILTTDTTTDSTGILLTEDCILSVGKKYTISLDVRNLIDDVQVENPGFELKVNINGEETTVTNTHTFDELNAETSVIVHLVPPSTAFNTGLVIKPQIEEGEQKTNWVPYMKNVGTYVDERFNGTNAKIKVLAESVKDGTSGMPTVDADGNGLISTERYIAEYIDGKWVAVKLSVYNGETV